MCGSQLSFQAWKARNTPCTMSSMSPPSARAMSARRPTTRPQLTKALVCRVRSRGAAQPGATHSTAGHTAAQLAQQCTAASFFCPPASGRAAAHHGTCALQSRGSMRALAWGQSRRLYGNTHQPATPACMGSRSLNRRAPAQFLGRDLPASSSSSWASAASRSRAAFTAAACGRGTQAGWTRKD